MSETTKTRNDDASNPAIWNRGTSSVNTLITRRRGLVAPRPTALFNSALCIGSEETEKAAQLQRHRQAIKPAVARWPELIATLA